MTGQEISEAWKDWRDSEEGQRCQNGTATGEYLRNRLEVAFQAGIAAASLSSWTRTADGLPKADPESERVDFYVPGNQGEERIERGRYWADPPRWLSVASGTYRPDQVSHWRPLPEPPKSETPKETTP